VLDRKQIIACAVGLVVVLGVGVGGYLWGQATAPERREADAARESDYSAALASAQADAESAARSRGQEAGRRAGERAGELEGTREGESVGGAEVDEELAATTGTSSTAETTSTDDSCGPGQYNYQGNGCVPLNCPGAGCAHPPTPPATPETCPPGWTPAGQTGACAPP
jgi:hypothetical protein